MKEQDLQNCEIITNDLNALLNNDSAVSFCVTLFQIAQLFDDLYDNGTMEKLESIELMQKTMIDIPNNQFYCAFKHKLQPLIESWLLQWASANKLEDNKEQLEKSYMLRAFLYQIFHFSGMLLKGSDFAFQNADIFQKMYGESFNEYVKEFVYA